MTAGRILPALACLAATLVPPDADASETVFAPGIISTDAIEDAFDISPDGQLLVFSRRDGEWGAGSGPGTLYQSRWIDGRWTAPSPLPFSGQHDDGDPAFAPNGRHLYFTSTRPVDGASNEAADIWVAERVNGAWREPRHLGASLNSPAQEYSPSATDDGSLFFASMRAGGLGQGDLYVARRGDGGLKSPQNLGAMLNTPRGEWNVHAAPDGSYLVFEASGRSTNRSASGDLYVAYRNGDSWSAPVALAAVNTTESELNARRSPDGSAFLFVRSTRRADGTRQADIFSMPAAEVLPHLADPRRPRVLAVSRSRHEVFVIEAGSWRPLFRYATGQGPHEVAVSPDGRHAYTADYGQYPEPHDEPIEPGPIQWREAASGVITEIDLARAGATRPIAVRDCHRNHGILLARAHPVAWTTCEEEGAVQEIDLATGAQLRRWATATGSHQLVATPDERWLITSNVESGSVSLIDLQTNAVVTLPTGAGAEGLALSPDGRWLWVGNGQGNSLSVVDLERKRVVATFASGGRFPVKLAFTTDGTQVWVVNTASRSIVIFDAGSRRIIRNLDYDSPPLGILAAPDGETMLVTFPRRNEVAVLSTATGERIATVAGIVEADGLAWVQPGG